MTAVGKVYKQANSLGCIIPKEITKKLGLKAGDYIVWEIGEKGAVIRKLER